MQSEGPLIEEVDEHQSSVARPVRPIPQISFQDEGELVTIKFSIPNGVVVNKKVSGIVVTWSETKLRLHFSDDVDHPILEGELRGAIKIPTPSKWGSDCETRWLVENGSMFVIHLEKVDKSVTWHRLFSAAHYQGKAESGDVGEQINLALQFEGREEDKSFYWWKKAADSGNSHAELNVGKRYRDGQGVEKDEAKYQEYFVRAALNDNPEPLALLQVGIWMKKNELLDFGKTSLLGRSYRELFDRGVRLFPTMQAGELCGKQLVQEYLAENNLAKAQEYASLINLRLAPSSTPSKPKQTVAPPSPPPVSPSNSHLKSTTPRADKRPASHASQEANLAFWRNIAVGAVALAAAVVVVSLVAKKK